jgi:hypothetical protein
MIIEEYRILSSLAMDFRAPCRRRDHNSTCELLKMRTAEKKRESTHDLSFLHGLTECWSVSPFRVGACAADKDKKEPAM